MNKRLFIILPDKNYKGQVAWLVSMLQSARSATLKLIQHLSKADLDKYILNHNNSISSLLMHIAAMEFNTQCITFLHREMNERETRKWKNALPGGMEIKKKRSLSAECHSNLLQQVRTGTLASLKEKDTPWLKQFTRPYKNTSNNFMWFHLLEDELCHQGQIKSLVKALK
jgi:uncharacterized damage-inducible protein DinB